MYIYTYFYTIYILLYSTFIYKYTFIYIYFYTFYFLDQWAEYEVQQCQLPGPALGEQQPQAVLQAGR